MAPVPLMYPYIFRFDFGPKGPELDETEPSLKVIFQAFGPRALWSQAFGPRSFWGQAKLESQSRS